MSTICVKLCSISYSHKTDYNLTVQYENVHTGVRPQVEILGAQACPLVFDLLLRRATNVPLSVSSRASCGLINFEDNDQESMASIRRG